MRALPEADVIEGFVVNAVGLVSVLNKLMDWEGGVVGLDDGVGDLGGGDDGESVHDTVGVLLADFGDEECAHTGTGTTTEGVGQLESLNKSWKPVLSYLIWFKTNRTHLEAVAWFGFLADDIENGVDQLGTFGVVTLGPVVTGARLSKDKVVGAENLSEGARSDGVHGTGLQIDQDGAWYVFTTSCLVVVDIDAL